MQSPEERQRASHDLGTSERPLAGGRAERKTRADGGWSRDLWTPEHGTPRKSQSHNPEHRRSPRKSQSHGSFYAWVEVFRSHAAGCQREEGRA